MASNVQYHFENGIGYGKLPDGTTFVFDEECFDKVRPVKWYISLQGGTNPRPYLIDRSGRKMHTYLIRCPKEYEVDHISLDTLDNRKSNLRICTHQQNQCNQPLQCNNTSGVSGVSFYAPRGKYRARIKIGQHDIHLGYYSSFAEAVQARNVGMECMFGEYGRYNDAAPEPAWIRTKATEQCRRFAEYRYVWLYKVRAKPVTENYATKEGKSITRQTGEVEWTAIRRTHDNQYQAVADEEENGFTAAKGATFLQSVYEPVFTSDK